MASACSFEKHMPCVVYATCRKLFRDELGAEPSEKTANVFLGILRSGS